MAESRRGRGGRESTRGRSSSQARKGDPTRHERRCLTYDTHHFCPKGSRCTFFHDHGLFDLVKDPPVMFDILFGMLHDTFAKSCILDKKLDLILTSLKSEVTADTVDNPAWKQVQAQSSKIAGQYAQRRKTADRLSQGGSSQGSVYRHYDSVHARQMKPIPSTQQRYSSHPDLSSVGELPVGQLHSSQSMEWATSSSGYTGIQPIINYPHQVGGVTYYPPGTGQYQPTGIPPYTAATQSIPATTTSQHPIHPQ